MSYAFVFRAYPDVDHVAPLAWRLLEEGEEVHAIISPGYEPENDYRLRFLSGYPGFHLHRVQGPVRRTLLWALWVVLRADVRLVGVEWGYGLNEGYERLGSARGILDVLRSVAGSVRRMGDPHQTRANFMVAARLLRRPVVCLPHGLSIKTGLGAGGRDPLAKAMDWRDRNRFAAYVFNTDHHRRWFLEHAQGDPAVMQAWGALRWAPDWVEINRDLAPSFTWPAEPWRHTNGAPPPVKVIFMVPKWKNHVNKAAVLELVKRLQSVSGISLAIKGHPRPKDGSADPLRDDPEIDWERVHDITPVDSVSAIAAADVVIDVGSSIGLEVVMQGKVLVNPCYLHNFWTFFDDIPGSCVRAETAEEVLAYLRRHAQGDPQPVTEPAFRELLRRGVYASRDEPFDVLGAYSRHVRELAGATPATRS